MPLTVRERGGGTGATPAFHGSFGIQNLRRLAPYGRAFEILGGALLIASGLYLLNAYFVWVPALAA